MIAAIFMAVTLHTAPSIDSERDLKLRFLPYQLDAIYTEKRKNLAKKAVRVGYTYAKAFKAVRTCIQKPRQTVLFTSKDQPTAFEFIETCAEHIEHFDRTRDALSPEILEIPIPAIDENGKSFTEIIKVGSIKFNNKSRILAFSSNPNALRAYGGHVYWDEAAWHPKGKEMWTAAQGRARWGFDIDVWSSLSYEDVTFDVLAEEAEKRDDWGYEFVDINKAVEQGLVELINETQGLNQSREDFLRECKEDALTEDIYALEYLIRKQNTLAAIVSWPVLKSCERDYKIDRAHLSDDEIIRLFGAPHLEKPGQRRKALEDWSRGNFPTLFNARKSAGKQFRLGFDVAASRTGDLAAIYIDEKTSQGLQCAAVLTFRTEDWDIMQWANEIFLASIPGEIKGAGDETGLGKQICWNLGVKFYGRFDGVNFTGLKQELGTHLMGELAARAKIIPAGHPDITQDFYSIRKGTKGNQVYFFQGRNNLLPASHGDIAWAGALASWADRIGTAEYWGGTVG